MPKIQYVIKLYFYGVSVYYVIGVAPMAKYTRFIWEALLPRHRPRK